MADKAIRRPEKALSSRFVDTVDKPGKYFDGGGSGLFVLVKKNGTKFFVQRLTINGSRIEIGLGSVSATKLHLAREAAADNKRLARQGIDPRKKTNTDGRVPNFAEASEAFLKFKMKEFSNAKHRAQWTSTLQNHAFPKIGKLSVDVITVNDIQALLQPIWFEKTETASRLRQRIEAILDWAKIKGYRSGENPAIWRGNLSGLLPRPSKIANKKHFPAIPVGSAAKWWADLQMRDGVGAQALAFLTLCASRSGEVRQMTWDQLDLFDEEKAAEKGYLGLWTIPAPVMKMRRVHRVPISRAAKKILLQRRSMTNGSLVFPSRLGSQLSDMTMSQLMRRMNEANQKKDLSDYLDEESKKPGVPHGLRSTFRNWAAEHGFPNEMAEIQLAHKVGSETTQAYLRTDLLAARANMLERWSAFLKGDPL
mgnify:CR=1 FL=1